MIRAVVDDLDSIFREAVMTGNLKERLLEERTGLVSILIVLQFKMIFE